MAIPLLEHAATITLAQIPDNLSSVAHVIQLAVAPVFLLTGVGAILGVLTNRLGRIVDRFRALEERHQLTESRDVPGTLRAMQALPGVLEEIHTLQRRAHLIQWAIGLSTGCALSICLVIALLFIGSVAAINLSTAIALLFIIATTSLVCALLAFLREIKLAYASIRFLRR